MASELVNPGGRIRQLERKLHIRNATYADIFTNIPDLSLDDLKTLAREVYDYSGFEYLYETDTYKQSEKEFVECFLRNAIEHVSCRQRAVQLGIEAGFWRQEG